MDRGVYSVRKKKGCHDRKRVLKWRYSVKRDMLNFSVKKHIQDASKYLIKKNFIFLKLEKQSRAVNFNKLIGFRI